MTDPTNDRLRWQCIDKIFDGALDLPQNEREAYLDEMVGGDPDLRADVEALLASDERVGGLLDRPVAAYVSQIVGWGSRGEPRDRSGEQIAGYDLIRRLGWGGMGEVYEAVDPKRGAVAVKVLHEDLAADPGLVSRLRREARLLTPLEHPRITRLYALVEHAGARLLVMELVDGETLAARLNCGPLPVAESLRVCAQIAEGLDALHAARVIHRDLKPGNVLLDRRGGARLADFGVARSVEVKGAAIDSSFASHSDLTESGVQPGTVPYMSPEQLRGDRLDARTDVWALGCTLYECLTGTGPFQRGTTVDTVAAILSDEPEWARLPPTAPARVRGLLQHVLRKEPDDRQLTAGEIWLELGEL